MAEEKQTSVRLKDGDHVFLVDFESTPGRCKRNPIPTEAALLIGQVIPPGLLSYVDEFHSLVQLQEEKVDRVRFATIENTCTGLSASVCSFGMPFVDPKTGPPVINVLDTFRLLEEQYDPVLFLARGPYQENQLLAPLKWNCQEIASFLATPDPWVLTQKPYPEDVEEYLGYRSQCGYHHSIPFEYELHCAQRDVRRAFYWITKYGFLPSVYCPCPESAWLKRPLRLAGSSKPFDVSKPVEFKEDQNKLDVQHSTATVKENESKKKQDQEQKTIATATATETKEEEWHVPKSRAMRKKSNRF